MLCTYNVYDDCKRKFVFFILTILWQGEGRERLDFLGSPGHAESAETTDYTSDSYIEGGKY